MAVKLMYTDYKSLPDSMEANELADYFNEFISIYSDKPKNVEALNQLHELAYRQWDTYESLDEDIAAKIESYLMSAIDFKSYEIMDSVISIVENLTMKNVFEYIINNKSSVSASSILNLIEEAEEEYADSIDNPYENLDDWL